MSSNLHSSVDEYLDSVVPGFEGMDLRTAAGIANFIEYDPLMAESWTRSHTLPMIEAVERAQFSYHDVAVCLHNPSAIRAMLLFDLLMAKEAEVGTDTYMRVFSFYASTLTAICIEDPFAREFKNKIHTHNDVREIVESLDSADRSVARSLGKLGNACYSLSHALYTDMNPQLVYDNFGPYYLDDGQMYAKKIFHNLRPTDLWPEIDRLPVSDIDIDVLFKDVTLAVDSTTHAIYTGNQVENMCAWRCVMDGKSVSVDQIDSVCKQIEEYAISIYTKVKVMKIPDTKRLYCFQRAWGYKNLFLRLGLDWEPDPEVLAAMEGERLFDRLAYDGSTGHMACPIRDLLDPRQEIPALAWK